MRIGFAWLRHRLRVWKQIFWRPWVRIVGGLYGVLGLLAFVREFVRDKLSPQHRLTFDEWYKVPDLSWQTWVIIGLVLSLCIALEGAYRVSLPTGDEKRRRIGNELVRFHREGEQLVQEIVKSDDGTSFQYWNEKVQAYRQRLFDYISQEVSPARAASVDAVPSSFNAIDRTGMCSVETKEDKTRLLQRLEYRLHKVSVLMGEH
jgi:hypothetical protein